MDELAAGLSRTALGPEVANAYERAFNKIVHFAENVRGHTIPPDELGVTTRFAMPFTPGGLLVLLEEPLSYHPWHEGIDRVIATCNTLDALNEGIQIASKGHLKIKDDVSVLDLRPFLPKKDHDTLENSKWEELYDLVFSAIEAKKAEVLLCMGDEATNAIKARMTPQAGFNQRCHGTEIVNAMHPGHSVNHNKTKADTRLKLFQSIIEACCKLWGDYDADIYEEQFRANVLMLKEMPASVSRFKVSEDTKCLERFLEVVLRSCFRPKHILPVQSVAMGLPPRYKLKFWHKKWFGHMENYLNSTEDRENQARTLLIPVFKQFNGSFRRASWFLPIYDVDWQDICQVFTDRIVEIEYACYLLAGDTVVDTDVATSGRSSGSVYQDQCHVLAKMEEITAHATKLWEDRRPHPQRVCQYVGFAEDE